LPPYLHSAVFTLPATCAGRRSEQRALLLHLSLSGFNYYAELAKTGALDIDCFLTTSLLASQMQTQL
jgi:hypothetical protein